MAMTRQLYSISALATELNRDRRTVAKALDTVIADGTVAGGHRAWFLKTALQALKEVPKEPGQGPLFAYLARLEDWREIHTGELEAWSIEDLASVLGKPVSAVLTWLRAGCPYLEAGDFETGAGFMLHPAWVIDWYLAASTLAVLTKDKAGAASLQLK